MENITEYNTDELTLAIFGDMHAGSPVGLCPPSVRLDDGGIYQASAFQRRLLEAWLDYWSQAEALKGKGQLVSILNGDVIDGDHHRTIQLITHNLEIQRRMALELLDPMRRLSDAVIFIRGTDAHDGRLSTDLESIARELGGKEDEYGRHAHYHLKIDFGKRARIDCAHVGKVGRLPWTNLNGAISLAREIELVYYAQGLRPPDLAFRSHYHRFIDTYDNAPVRVIGLGCWQGPTSYVYHRSPMVGLPHIGGAIVKIINGEIVNVIKCRYNDEQSSFNLG